MKEFKELIQSADWKQEKHVPVIDAPDKVKKAEMFTVAVTIGKQIPHPNKAEHHIRWIELYFHPEGGQFPYQIAKTEFCAHGESGAGPDTSGVYVNHETLVSFKTDKSGTIYAVSYCNIHGLWQNARQIDVE
jgi:superoxide reductase